MTTSSNIIAHQDQLKILTNCYLNRFPHSWIFHGKRGVGKYTTLIEFIKKNCDNKKNLSQRVFEINSDEKPALLDDVRSLINQINLTNSNSNQKAFIIINNADILNFNSYNALLKIIEEPPTNTVIFIISHNLKKIPKTILSRCSLLAFHPLNKNQITKYCNMFDVNLNGFNLDENINLVGGSISKLQILIDDNGKLAKEQLLEIIQDKSFKIAKFEKLYELISKDYPNYSQMIFDCIFENLKKKYLKYSDNRKISRNILKYFSQIEIFTKQNLNIDKKKELHYLLSEYIKTNNHEK